MNAESAHARDLEDGDCLCVLLRNGLWGAAIVLAIDRRDATHVWTLIGDLDYMSHEKPPVDVFEKREWLVLSHHGWNDERNILWYGPTDNGEAQVNAQVVYKTEIRSNDPKNVRVCTGWGSLGRQILSQRNWDEYRTRYGLNAQPLDYGSVICAAFEYILSVTARTPEAIEWYSSYQALEGLVGQIKASGAWEASDAWVRQGIHMAVQRLLFGLHGAVPAGPAAESRAISALFSKAQSNSEYTGWGQREGAFQRLCASVAELDRCLLQLRDHMLIHATQKDMLYRSTICRACEYVTSAMAGAPQAIEWYRLYLALENLIKCIKSRGGWVASDSYGRGGIRGATHKMLSNLENIILNESGAESSQMLALVGQARSDIEHRSSDYRDKVFRILCISVAELEESLLQLRAYILSRFTLEDML